MTDVSLVQTTMQDFVDAKILPNLYKVEFWIGVLTITVSMIMFFGHYRSRPAAPRKSDEGRLKARRERGESFASTWTDPDCPFSVVLKGDKTLSLEGLVPQSVPLDIVLTYSRVNKNTSAVERKVAARKVLKFSNCPESARNCTVSGQTRAVSSIQFGNAEVSVEMKVTMGDSELCIKPFVQGTDNKEKVYELLLHSLEWALGVSKGASFSNLSNVLMFQNGFQSWAPTGPVQTSSHQQYAMFNLPYLNRFISAMMHNVDSPVWGRKDILISEHFSAFQHADSDIAFVAGFLSSEISAGEIYFEKGSRNIKCLLDCNGRPIKSGTNALILEELILMKGATKEVFEDYAVRSVNMLETPLTLANRSPVGWCSWYELYGEVKESDILRNVELLASHPELGVEYVQLDDGYQAAIGDWLTCNQKFPHGLKAVAEHIQAHGFRAGIWVAPFLAGHSSKLYKDHPEWLVKNAGGTGNVFHFNPNWHEDSYTYAIDLTHPGVQKWLRDTFKTLREYGFAYFKLDYLIAGIRDGLRYNNDVSRVEAYRMGLRVIREAVGPDGFILGCGAPLAPSLGFLDGMRVSNDVADRWGPNALENIFACGEGVPCTQLALLSNCSRNFLHGIWWLNDPDCIVARSSNTGLTPAEVTTQVTLFGMTGGLIVLSDDLTNMAMDRLAMVQRIMPPSTNVRGMPLEPMRDRYPRTFCCPAEEEGDSTLIAYMNWAPHSVKRSVSLELPLLFDRSCIDDIPWTSSHYLFDFWGKTLLEDPLVDIEPHGVAAIIVSKRSMFPALVGNSFSLVGMCDGRLTGMYKEKSRRLMVRGHHISVLNGLLWVALPHRNSCGIDYELTSVKCSATIVESVETPEHTILKVSVSLAGRGSWQLGIAVALPGETVNLPKRIPSPSKRRDSIDQYVGDDVVLRSRAGSNTSPQK